eukprot:TRINITY_DN5783_c0_g2_i1.p1 TRINITY_DN5783_c0_g2~~TRINITY_DN5783_c0_g2_i1.p1  ORF type:complete len:106 (+),score=6.58 TRINITY_DN5783_c0_g2_i1:162-479(+)
MPSACGTAELQLFIPPHSHDQRFHTVEWLTKLWFIWVLEMNARVVVVSFEVFSTLFKGSRSSEEWLDICVRSSSNCNCACGGSDRFMILLQSQPTLSNVRIKYVS